MAGSKDDGQEQQDERTPLLNKNKKKDSDAQSQRSSSSRASGESSESQSVHSVSNLGDFEIQPSTLAKAVEEKDVQIILKEIGEEGSSDKSKPQETLCQALQSDYKKGLAQDQTSEEGAEERIRIYGRNKLPEKELQSFFAFLWDAFKDKVLIILTIAAAVSFALGMYQDFGPQHDPEEPRVNWVEGVAIMTAIVIVTVTSSVNDYSKERQFKALSETKEIPNVNVLRDGKKYKTIKSTDVLVGDIVHVTAGDILTCDGIILNMQKELKVDESDATGESDAISKTSVEQSNASGGSQSSSGNQDEGQHETGSSSSHKKDKNDASDKSDPVLLSGSKVLEGEGHFLVVAVGQSSFQGKIFMSLRSSQPDQTRMQKQLAALAEQIAKLASIAGGLLLFCLFLRNFIELKTKPDRTPAEKGQGFIQSFVIAVTLVVVAVPEGLPLAVTLALAFATNRMTSHNLLVRVFEACETMSNANVVVTDKTGTLTANEMRVVEGTIAGVAFNLRSKDSQQDNNNKTDDNSDDEDADTSNLMDDKDVKSTEELIELFKKNEKIRDIFAESVAINSTAFEEGHEENQKDSDKGKGNKKGNSKQKKQDKKSKQGNGENGHDDQSQGEEHDDGPKFVGNKTESALLRMLEVDLADVRKRPFQEIRESAETVLLLPFSSDRKAMATVVRLPGNGSKYRVYVKGAAEVVAGLCTKRAKLESGGDEEKDDIDQDQIQKLVDSYAKRALRAIAMAYKDLDEWPPKDAGKDSDGKVSYDDIAKDLTLLAIPGIEDPLREGVSKAVENCHVAGVNVKMCTGDNLLTAKAIAKQCGIYKGGEAISGSDWRKLSDEEKREKAPKIEVMARSLPQDKETLVQALSDGGKIVGVTDDGTNDALALKKADVGFSMGIAGTEVAKEASDVIIMDDNFASLVGAISWGRCVSDAVRKFLQFQLAVNTTAIVITFVSSVTGGDENSIMNAVQLLWVNLIMDTFAALALATDPADDSLLKRKPEPRETPIITVSMTKMIIVQAIYQITITLTLHFVGPKILKPITKGRQPSSPVRHPGVQCICLVPDLQYDQLPAAGQPLQYLRWSPPQPLALRHLSSDDRRPDPHSLLRRSSFRH